MFDLERFDENTRKLLNEIENERVTNPESCLKKCRQLLKLSALQKEDGLHAYAGFSECYCLYVLNHISDLSLRFGKVIPELTKTGQWELVARSYSMLGIISSAIGNIPMAMDNYLQAIKVCKEHDLGWVSAIVDCNIGVLYLGFHDLENAIRYFKRAIETAEEIKTTHGDYEPYLATFQTATLYVNLTTCYVRMEDFERARQNLEMARGLEKQEPNLSLHLGVVILEAQIAYAAGDMKLLSSCVEEFDQALGNMEALLDSVDDIMEYAAFLQKIGRIKEFWNLVASLEHTVRTTNSPYLYRRIVELKINFYKEHGENKEYLMAAGLYYELSMKMEKEREQSYRESMSIRISLEEAKQEKAAMEAEATNLRFRSEVDALTGLRNRFKILSLIEDSFIQCAAEKKYFAIEILDVDYFKQYNDNYGHQRGDMILKEVADAIHSLERHRGIYTGRYGGDEFLLLFVDRTKDEVGQFMQELKDIIEHRHIIHEYSKSSDIVTLSQGAYHGIPTKDSTIKQFMEDADQALYKIKKAGRDGFLVTSEDDKE